ncbi:MAG TPA: ribonuclease HII [Chloroflexi bacterium]|nr:ribonuclease HII [Chloroflexota bacterium]
MTRKIDPGLIPPSPNLQFERALWKANLTAIAGIDEAGRGCLAGPVAAAAVILPDDEKIIKTMTGIRDSKQLTAEEREKGRTIIEKSSLAWAVGFADNQEIDRLGIVPATRLAAWRALDQLDPLPEHLLVDYLVLPDIPLPQTRLVKGDARSLSIAAASILAKTHRDAVMVASASIYSGYGFEKNKGYGTIFHRNAIRSLGACPLHRMSFAPLRVIGNWAETGRPGDGETR